MLFHMFELSNSCTYKEKLDNHKAYQKIIMPFLEPIVYPPKRNKYDIEQTVYIWNVLRPCTKNIKMASKK